MSVESQTLLNITVQDDVTGGLVNGFCVDLTQEVTTGQNTSCTQLSAGTYPKNSTSLCGSSKTCTAMIDEMNNQTWAQIIDTNFATNGGLAIIRRYSTEGTCTGTLCENQLTSGSVCPGTRSLSGDDYCQVTDHLSAAIINFAMGTNQTRYELLHNMSELLRHPGADQLQCWNSRITGSGVYNDYTDLCISDDSASDASLGILQGYSIACAKVRAGIWTNGSVDYCADYLYQGQLIWAYEIKKLSNGRYFLCNGRDNAAGSCPTHYQSFRPDYYNLGALMDYAEYTNNATQMTGVLQMAEAYNLSFGTNHIPIGKTGYFSSTGLTYTCGSDQLGNEYPTACSGAGSYMDSIDNWRGFFQMSRFYNVHSDRINGTLQTNMFDYWWNSLSLGNSSYTYSTSKPIEVYSNAANGFVKSTSNDYKTSAMHIALASKKDPTTASLFADYMVNSQWLGTKFSGAAYMGGYFSQYAVNALGDVTGMIDPNTWSGALVCTEGSTTTYQKNGLEITLNNPLNQSSTSSTTVILNITAINRNITVNVTTTTTNTSGVLFNSSFAASPATQGWTLNSWQHDSTNQWMRYNSSDFGSGMYTQNLTLGQINNYLIRINMSVGNITNAKIYFGTTSSGSANGDRILIERTGSGSSTFNWKHDGGNYSSVTAPIGAFNNLSIRVNRTEGSVTVCAGTTGCWKEGIQNSHAYGDYITFLPGSEMSRYWNISDINITNLDGSTVNGSSISYGNPNMTVTFLNGSGSVLSTHTLIGNNTRVNHTLTGLADGTYNWGVRLTSENNNETFTPLQFTVSTSIGSNATYCTLGQSITHNTTGTYTIAAYSIGTGTGASGIYFNTTPQEYAFTSNASLQLSSWQAWLKVQAYRLFLNTSINTFNATTGAQSTANTSNGTLYLKASQGINSITVNVPGNYSQNYNFTAAVVDTTQVNATGIHDARITFSVLQDTTSITGYTILASNTTLGGNLVNQSTVTATNIINLIQGYAYNFTFIKSGYTQQNVTLTPTNTSSSYTFSIPAEGSLNITFYNEKTGALLNNVTVSLELISDVDSSNYTTTTGMLFINNTPEAEYLFKYSATGYHQRFYIYNLTTTQDHSLTLYLLDTTNGTSVTITVKDTLDSPVENARVKTLKYNILTNTYDLIQSSETNFEGETKADLILNDPFYKFVVEYQGKTVLTTTETQIYATTLTLVVNLVDGSGYNTIFNTYNLYGELDVNNNLASCTYNDATMSTTQTCLTIYDVTNAKTQYNQTCSQSVTGLLNTYFANTTGRSYQIVCTATLGGEEYTLDTQYLTNPVTIDDTSETLLLLFFMVIIFTACLLASVEVAVAVASFVPLMFIMAGLSPLSIAGGMAIFGLGIVLAFIIGVVRR